jgi:hypothetical protein
MGLDRGGWLLTAGESLVLSRILALGQPALSLYARLSSRVPQVFEVATLRGVDAQDLQRLREAQLVDGLVSWPQRAHHLTVPALKHACAGLGLRRGGKKADLIDRLTPHTHWHPGPWIRVRHKSLIRRLERWAFLRRRADRSTLVVERLGNARWPQYAPTSGPGPHRDRRSMHRWEALAGQALTVDHALTALKHGHTVAGGRLDLTHRVRSDLLDHARSLEAPDPTGALGIYEALQQTGSPPDPVRHARALERQGRPAAALQLLREARKTRTGPGRIALNRAGKRLARQQRQGWAPDAPLSSPPRRVIRLPPASTPGTRPLYDSPAGQVPVEAAVVGLLHSLGRRAIHAENSLWTTLFALFFAEAYFLPVPGALPGRWLAGPLDLGTPAFKARRTASCTGIAAALRAGEGPDRLVFAHEKWTGIHLMGARWDLSSNDLAGVVEGLGPAALADIMGHLLDRGFSAARGLPDLAILPGPPVVFPDALPAKLGPDLTLAEVKGPGDTVRDAQALWFHRLGAAGAPIALWEVRPLPGVRTR